MSDLTKRIAAIGSHGRNANNCERDLWRALNLPVVSHLEINAGMFSIKKHLQHVVKRVVHIYLDLVVTWYVGSIRGCLPCGRASSRSIGSPEEEENNIPTANGFAT